MLTRRGRLLLVLGGALYVAAWAFGSRALYPVAIGFLLTVLVSALSVHAAARPMAYRRRSDSIEHVEGTTSCSTSSSSRAARSGWRR